jgi:hypothetical protein
MNRDSAVASKRNCERRAARTRTHHRVTHTEAVTLFSGKHRPSKVDVRRVEHRQKVSGRKALEGEQLVACLAPFVRRIRAVDNASPGIGSQPVTIDARGANRNSDFCTVTRNNSDGTRIKPTIKRLKSAKCLDRGRDRRTRDGWSGMKQANKVNVGDPRTNFGLHTRREVLDVGKAKQPRLRIDSQSGRARCECLAHALDDQFMLTPILRTREEGLTE